MVAHELVGKAQEELQEAPVQHVRVMCAPLASSECTDPDEDLGTPQSATDSQTSHAAAAPFLSPQAHSTAPGRLAPTSDVADLDMRWSEEFQANTESKAAIELLENNRRQPCCSAAVSGAESWDAVHSPLPPKAQTPGDARLMAQLRAYSGQIAALQEELNAQKELGETRQETIDQMASQVRKKALEAGQLESQVHSLRGAASESEELRLRVRLLAEHNCRLVGAWKGLLADHGVDVGAVRQPSLGDVLAQGKEATEMALSVQLLGLEQCRAVLQQARTAAGEGQKERMALQERAGALSAELEGSKTREAAAAQRSAQLEQQLQHMRQSRGASEHAIRRAAEEEVMQGQVAKMIQTHTATVASLQAAASKAEAAISRQVAAEAAAQSLKQQLEQERSAGQQRERGLAAEAGAAKDRAARVERSEAEAQQRLRWMAQELQRAQADLSAANRMRSDETAAFRGKLAAAEDKLAKQAVEAGRAVEREQERASEARRALNDLLCEVESMSASLEAEKARAGSLSAALSTTREMVKTVKIQIAEKEAEITRLQEVARYGSQQWATSAAEMCNTEDSSEAQRVAAELQGAHEMVSQMSGRMEALERELTQRREDSAALQAAQREVDALRSTVATLRETRGARPAAPSSVDEEVDWLYAPPSPVRSSHAGSAAGGDRHAALCTHGASADHQSSMNSVDLFHPAPCLLGPASRRGTGCFHASCDGPPFGAASHCNEDGSGAAATSKEQELCDLVEEVRRLQVRMSAKQQATG